MPLDPMLEELYRVYQRVDNREDVDVPVMPPSDPHDIEQTLREVFFQMPRGLSDLLWGHEPFYFAGIVVVREEKSWCIYPWNGINTWGQRPAALSIDEAALVLNHAGYRIERLQEECRLHIESILAKISRRRQALAYLSEEGLA